MRCQNVQHAFTVRDAAARQNLVTEDDFLPVVMQSRTIEKQTLLVWLLDSPTAEATRDFLYVLLRVCAIDTERVQLHQLAGILFIRAAVRRCSSVTPICGFLGGGVGLGDASAAIPPAVSCCLDAAGWSADILPSASLPVSI